MFKLRTLQTLKKSFVSKSLVYSAQEQRFSIKDGPLF